jgi:beta-lactamase class A
MKRHIALLLTIVLVAAAAHTQQTEPAEALRRLFTTGVDAVEYTDRFLQAVPKSELGSVIDQIQSQIGQFREVRGEQNPFTVVSANGTATANIQLTEAGAIAGLRFTRIEPAASSLQEAAARLRDLPGEVAFVVTEDGSVAASHNAEAALAVGSSFKLAVLAAVDEAVSRGTLSWDQVVSLEPEWKSLPSGFLQTWPAGSALTVETLATLMISQSDNTATDALIDLLGRRAVEEFAPNTRPFLTTREAFVLKDPENASLKERYLAAGNRDKRRILDELEGRALPDPSLFTGGPVSPEVEWFFTVRRLCSLIEQVSDLDLTTVNPGPASPEQWSRVSFKGGSEPGVLNLTTRVVSNDGTRYCVSATQNRDAAIDETAFIVAYQGLIGSLR